MLGKYELSGADRDFFRIVTESVFSNPFATETYHLACAIAGGDYKPGDVLNQKMVTALRQRLEKVTEDNCIPWKQFSGEDRELIRVAVLYDTYHHCFNDFDQLISKQIDKGAEPCEVPFAKDNLSLLHQRKFKPEESLRYFAFYYQLRRAWYFIHHGLIGQSLSMEKLRSHLWRSIFTYDARWYERFLWNRMEDFSTFLVGETGTGKGTAAAAIGRSGFIPFNQKTNRFAESFTSNFIEINLSQYPESLIESELFGHRKGAFTGAIDSYKGVFALCSQYGSIFLDEIGDVSIPVQIKLLKVLEERNFTSVGSHEKRHFYGRIIAATNKRINQLRQDNVFRKDFYYRLCSNVINVPTLRDQLQEEPSTLETLLEHTIQKIIGEPSRELQEVVSEVIDRQVGADYQWPGNVRELEQAVRCILLNKNYTCEADAWNEIQKNPLRAALEDTQMSVNDLITSYCSTLYDKYKTYQEVARITQLDSRTVKKYIQSRNNLIQS